MKKVNRKNENQWFFRGWSGFGDAVSFLHKLVRGNESNAIILNLRQCRDQFSKSIEIRCQILCRVRNDHNSRAMGDKGKGSPSQFAPQSELIGPVSV